MIQIGLEPSWSRRGHFAHETFFFGSNVCTRPKKRVSCGCPRRDTTGTNLNNSELVWEIGGHTFWFLKISSTFIQTIGTQITGFCDQLARRLPGAIFCYSFSTALLQKSRMWYSVWIVPMGLNGGHKCCMGWQWCIGPPNYHVSSAKEPQKNPALLQKRLEIFGNLPSLTTLYLPTSILLSRACTRSLACVPSVSCSLSPKHTHAHTRTHTVCIVRGEGQSVMGWLRLVGSSKIYVSFAKEPYKRDLYSAKET